MIYELALADFLSAAGQNALVFQTVSIGLYLFASGIGVLAFQIKPPKNTLQFLVISEFFLIVIAFLSLPLLYQVTNLQATYTLGLLLSFTIGFLTGLELPIFISFINRPPQWLMGLNYFGALWGSLIFTFFLLPRLDIQAATWTAATTNLIVLVLIVLKQRQHLWVLPALATFIFAIIMLDLHNFNYLYKRWMEQKICRIENKSIFTNCDIYSSQRSLYQKQDFIDINVSNNLKILTSILDPTVQNANFPSSTFAMLLNGQVQFHAYTINLYHEYFAHVPIQLNNTIPKRVLVMGGGDGLLVNELLKYKDVESIDLVELDQMIIDTAKTNEILLKFNKKSLFNSKVHITIADAFGFSKKCPIKYDAIYLDFPYPNSFDVQKLYSQEFYTRIQKCLAPKGFMALDLPLNDKDHLLNSVLISTIHYSGLKQVQPFFSAPKIYVDTFSGSTQIYNNPISEGFVLAFKSTRILNSTYNNLNIPLVTLDSRKYKDSIQNIISYDVAEKYIDSVFRPKFTYKLQPLE